VVAKGAAAKAASGGRARNASFVERVGKVVGRWGNLFGKHELGTLASAIAFKALVAAVALVMLGLGVLGALGRRDVWDEQIASHIEGRVLPDVYKGIEQTVDRIFAHNSAGLIVFASLLAIWQVSGAVRVTMIALNRVYEEDETRPWWLRFVVSIALAVPVIAALLGAVLLVMAAAGAVHGALEAPFAIGRWLVAVLLVGTAFGLLVRFAPAKRRAKKWVSVGAALVVAGWLVEAIAFRWYVTAFANFKTVTGSLTIMLVVTAFFYVASLILLAGIEADELLRRDAKKAERNLRELVAGLVRR
jgi:membrane protein